MSEDKAVIALPRADYLLRLALEAIEAGASAPLVMNVAGLKQAIRHHLDSKPAPARIEFKMMGPKLAFVVGNQCFTLDYEPDSDEEAEFMQRMLCHALSCFAPDVKTDAQPARAPLTDEQAEKILEAERMRWYGRNGPPSYEFAAAFARAVERAHGIGEAE
jgi:hypothetical protein